MKPKLRVLIVEDAEDDCLLLILELRRGGYEVDYQRVETASALREALQQPWDIILSDYSMPRFDALSALKLIKEARIDVPFILVSGTVGEDAAVEAMRAGAQDFFSKNKLTRLVPAVERELLIAQEKKKREWAEQQLRESEDRFAKAFQASPGAITITTLVEGIHLDVNVRYLELLGYKREEVIGYGLSELGIWVQPSKRAAIVERLRQQRTVHNEELQFKTKSGNIHDCLVSFEQIDLGTQPCMLTIITDITERKRTQQEVQFQAALLNTVGQAVISTDLEGHITYWNKAAELLYGWPAEEVYGRDIVSITGWKTSIKDDTEILDHLNRKESWSGEFLLGHRDGHRFPAWVTDTPIYDDQGNLKGVIGISSDISRLKHVEDALRESERFARSIVDALSAHIAILDETGTIITVNKAWHDFARANPTLPAANTSEGMNYLEVCDATTGDNSKEIRAVAAGIRAVMRGELINFTLEYAYHTSTAQRWFVAKVTLFPGEGPLRIVIAHEEVTERKLTENELTALYNATSFLFKADGLLNLGHQIVQAVIEEFGQLDCGVMLVDRQQGNIIRLSRSGSYSIYPNRPLRLDEPGLVAQCVRTGKLVYAPDVRLEADYITNEVKTRSELVVPLRTARGVIGVLDLQSILLDAFSERDQRILLAFAERAAAALETMQLYEEINQHAAELEWRVASRTAELQRAKEHVEAILTNSSDAVILLDANGYVLQVNPAFTDQFQYDSGYLFNKPLSIIIETTSAPLFTDTLLTVVTTHQVTRIDITCVRNDGSVFEAEFAVAPIVIEGKDEVNIICNVHDISQHKRAEENLRLALAKEKEVNELKSRFVSMVSHEFRTPLTIIQSSSELLERYNDRLAPERKQGHYEKIRGQIKRVTTMLDEILALSRAQSVGIQLSLAPVELKTFCQDILEETRSIARTHQLEFLMIGEECKLIHVDTKLMEQAIANLLSNAIKYSPEGSVVQLSLACEPEEIRIGIRDSGIGIPEKDLENLFEAFHRAGNVGSIAGTGLGLTIVKQAIEAHGGTVTVESVMGVGSTFTITIPTE